MSDESNIKILSNVGLWGNQTFFTKSKILEKAVNPYLQADDPFWTNFYPPNGWGCRCFVRNLSKREVEKAGLTVEKIDGAIDYITKKSSNKTSEVIERNEVTKQSSNIKRLPRLS